MVFDEEATKKIRTMVDRDAPTLPYIAEGPFLGDEVFRATLEQAVAQGLEGLALIDEHGTFVYMNHTCAAMYGFTTSELLGKSWKALYDPDQIALMDTQAFPALKAHGHWQGELVGRRKDGRLFYAELSLQQLKDVQYANARIACACRDITERKWAEAALRESEERYALALQGSNDGHWDWSLDTNYCYYSPRWKELLGYDDDELDNHHTTFLDRIHPEDVDRVKAAIQAHIGERAPYRIELRLRHKAGAYRWCRSRGQAIWNGKGEAVRMAGVLTDITEHKEAEERFRLVVECAPCGMVMVNDDGIIMLINSQIETLFHYRRNELIGRPVDVLLPQRYRQGHPMHPAALSAASGGGPMRGGRDLYGVRKDGTEFPIEIGLNPMSTQEGPMVLSSIVDITERKRTEEALRRAHDELEARVQTRTAELTASNAALGQEIRQRQCAEEALKRLNETLHERANALLDVNQELEAFSYSVSHDLRTPLRHLDGFADLLRKHAQAHLDEKGRHYLTVISSAAKRMGILIDDLLAFSRIGRAEFSRRPVSLHAVVEEVLRDFHSDVQERQIRWNISGLSHVVGDAAMLRLVFANLIGNALKYTRNRREAVIEIGHGVGREDEVVVFIRDNGVGFDPQYAHRLFGVFQRLHTDHQFEGNGIGLANVRRIIHRHGGRTWAEGRPDAGATFWFALPIPSQAQP
jgi:PAS domain S-box-containing protein